MDVPKSDVTAPRKFTFLLIFQISLIFKSLDFRRDFWMVPIVFPDTTSTSTTQMGTANLTSLHINITEISNKLFFQIQLQHIRHRGELQTLLLSTSTPQKFQVWKIKMSYPTIEVALGYHSWSTQMYHWSQNFCCRGRWHLKILIWKPIWSFRKSLDPFELWAKYSIIPNNFQKFKSYFFI